MKNRVVSFCSVLCLLILTGCFAKSDKPLLSGSIDPGFPKNDFGLELVGGQEFVGLNGMFLGQKSRGAFKMVDASLYKAAKTKNERNSVAKLVSFLKLYKSRDLYVVQETDSKGKDVYYYLAQVNGNDLWLSQMKLSSKELDGARERGIKVIGTRSATFKSRGELLDYARLWFELKGDRWAQLGDGNFKYKIHKAPKQVEKSAKKYIDLVCLFHAGHPQDPAVKNLKPPHNIGKQMLAVKGKDGEKFCADGYRVNADPAITYSLARALYKQKKYLKGDKGPGSYQLSERLMEQDVDLGYVLFAESFMNGHGPAKDIQKGREVLEMGVSRNHPVSMAVLAFYHRSGVFGKRNHKEALRLYNVSSDLGNTDATAEVGKMHVYGWGTQKDERKALEYFREAASFGSGPGNLELGKSYYFGRGVKRNYKRAFDYITEAADRQIPEAHYYKGFMYKHGQGVAQSRPSALTALKRAVDQGYEYAKPVYAETYYEDLKRAAKNKPYHKWLVDSANKGSRNSQFVLATKYLEGFDVQKSLSKGLGLLEKAIAQNHWKSMNYMASLYETGKFVQRDYKQAFNHYLKSAQSGSPLGQYKVGKFYQLGLNGKKDPHLAKGWYKKAALQGYEPAKKALEAPVTVKVPKLNTPKVPKINEELARAQKFERWARNGKDAYYYHAGLAYLNKLKDADNAEKNFIVAARKGDTWSQYYMGLIHSQYKRYPKHYNPEWALMWLYTAEKTGLKAGKNVKSIVSYYQQLEAGMKANSRINALDRSRECFNSNYRKCGK